MKATFDASKVRMQGYGSGPGCQYGNVYSGRLHVEHIGDLLYINATGPIYEKYNFHKSEMTDNLHEDFKYMIPGTMLILNARYIESISVE